MQPDKQPEPAEDGAPRLGTEGDSFHARLGKLAHDLARRLDPSREVHRGGLGTGEVAELRRLDIARGLDAATPAFWRLVVSELEKNELVHPAAGEQELTRWMAIVSCWAELAGLHRPRRPLGEALERAGVSELRLVRLLRAEGAALHDQLRKVAHQLRSAGEPVDFYDIAQLILSDEQDWREEVRQGIARRFFRSEHSRQTGEAEAGAD